MAAVVGFRQTPSADPTMGPAVARITTAISWVIIASLSF